MKNVFKVLVTSVVLALCTSVLAQEVEQNPESKIIAEVVVHVGFAPPEYRGKFSFQILADGEVREVNNKGELRLLAKLQAPLVKSLQTKIDEISLLELEEADGPICYDAPGIFVYATKTSDSTRLLIEKNIGCRTQSSLDWQAKDVARIVHSLESALKSL